MSVKLRWKKYSNGTKTAYLDIYNKGDRRKEYIGIKIKKNSSNKKELRVKAEKIRTKRHDAIIDNRYDIISEDKINTDFLLYYKAFIDEYLKAGSRKYIAAFKKFEEFLNTKKIKALKFKNLNSKLCQEFKDYLYTKSNLKGETPFDYFKRFRAIIKQALRDGFLRENPIDGIVVKKPKETLKKEILTIEEIQKLVKAKCGNGEVRRAFLFALFTGLGEAEFKILKWKNVQDGRLNINRCKTGEKVKIKLNDLCISIIGVESNNSNDLIFNLPSNTAINYHLSKWVKKAEIHKHITFYCARHSFGVLNVNSGANLKTISKLMGHRSTATTSLYLNYLEEAKDKAIDNLPKIEI